MAAIPGDIISKPLHLYNYHPQTKLGKGNVFTPVCNSVYRRCTPPGRHTSSLGRHPLGRHLPRRHTPSWQTPPGRHTPRQTPPLQRTIRILLECILVSKCTELCEESRTSVKKSLLAIDSLCYFLSCCWLVKSQLHCISSILGTQRVSRCRGTWRGIEGV